MIEAEATELRTILRSTEAGIHRLRSLPRVSSSPRPPVPGLPCPLMRARHPADPKAHRALARKPSPHANPPDPARVRLPISGSRRDRHVPAPIEADRAAGATGNASPFAGRSTRRLAPALRRGAPGPAPRGGPGGPARPADHGREARPARRQDHPGLLRRGLRRGPDDDRDQGEDRPAPPQVPPRRGPRAVQLRPEDRSAAAGRAEGHGPGLRRRDGLQQQGLLRPGGRRAARPAADHGQRDGARRDQLLGGPDPDGGPAEHPPRPPRPQGRPAASRSCRSTSAAIISGGDPTTNYQLMPNDRLVVYRDPKADRPPPAIPTDPSRQPRAVSPPPRPMPRRPIAGSSRWNESSTGSWRPWKGRSEGRRIRPRHAASPFRIAHHSRRPAPGGVPRSLRRP